MVYLRLIRLLTFETPMIGVHRMFLMTSVTNNGLLKEVVRAVCSSCLVNGVIKVPRLQVAVIMVEAVWKLDGGTLQYGTCSGAS